MVLNTNPQKVLSWRQNRFAKLGDDHRHRAEFFRGKRRLFAGTALPGLFVTPMEVDQGYGLTVNAGLNVAVRQGRSDIRYRFGDAVNVLVIEAGELGGGQVHGPERGKQ